MSGVVTHTKHASVISAEQRCCSTHCIRMMAHHYAVVLNHPLLKTVLNHRTQAKVAAKQGGSSAMTNSGDQAAKGKAKGKGKGKSKGKNKKA